MAQTTAEELKAKGDEELLDQLQELVSGVHRACIDILLSDGAGDDAGHTSNLRRIETIFLKLKDANEYLADRRAEESYRRPTDGFVSTTPQGTMVYQHRSPVIGEMPSDRVSLMSPKGILQAFSEMTKSSPSSAPSTPPRVPRPVPTAHPPGFALPPTRFSSSRGSTQKIAIPELNYEASLPVVRSMKDMRCAFYYYDPPDDAQGAPGIYCRFPNNNYIRVPFPDTINTKDSYNRMRSVRCKYGSLKNCTRIRQSRAERHRGPERPCNYAHTGETMIKVTSLTPQDLRSLMMHGASDLFLCLLLMQKHRVRNSTFSELDKA